MRVFKNAILPVVCTLAMSAGLVTAPDRAEAGSNPYLGDIMIVGFNFCPRGWAEAAGQLVQINQNQSLYALLGTQFGGDGRTTFALPDLRSRVAIGQGDAPGIGTFAAGQRGGAEFTTMTQASMPSHSHLVNANNLDGDKPGPGGKLLAAAPDNGTGTETIYSEQPANVDMSSEMITATGSGAPIQTLDPFLAVTHCIAMQGIFPSRN